MTKKIAFPAVGLLVVLAVLAAPRQRAQSQTQTPPALPHFDHIVIIVQENRTPDTLFGDGPASDPPSGPPVCAGQNGWAANIDLQNGGPNNYTSSGGGHMGCSNLTPLATLQKGGANHSFKDWTGQYDNGAMDGACNPQTSGTTCGQSQSPTNPPYIYVQKGTTANPGVVAPYFQIAQTYGWANYMFQTNEGPSFPAHQFLLSGTSAPTFAGDKFSKYFVADNPNFLNSGCTNSDSTLPWVDPTGFVTNPGNLGASPLECYDRNTLVTTQSNGVVSDRIDKAGTAISWRYYAQTRGIIWDAPEADPQTCYGLTAPPSGTPACSGAEFNHVRFPGTGNGQSAPILTDIQNCNLQKITWVTPDEVWSDHPGQDPNSLGPSWVADIINAIGQSKTNSNGKCDYWQAEPTAIFVTWDDWGGFYDHVAPLKVYRGTAGANGFSCSAPNGWGCGYVYGFRVPLLVISPFTTAGTVSGPISSWPPPPPDPCFTHDFGSVLAFTEQNFYPAGSQQIAPPGFTYADSNSLDATCNGASVVPLREFFTGSFRAFTAITAPFSASFFENYYNTTTPAGTLPTPQGPDADDDD